MTTDRELLQQLATFLANKPVISADEDSIRDMVTRYANPPFTLAYRAAIRITMTDMHNLNNLLKRINEHLKVVPDAPAPVARESMEAEYDDH